MTVTFYTNYINHHQLPIADEFYRILGHQYYFVELGNTADLVKAMNGYSLIERPYIIRPYKSNKDSDKAYKLAKESDIVIFGGTECLKYIIERYKSKAKPITFEYGEHWLKKGLINVLSPRFIINKLVYHFIAKKMYSFRLCASAHASKEENLFLSYRNHCLKWAYFTKIQEFDVDQSIYKRQQEDTVKILWIGRYLSWKHPEKMITLAKALKLRNKRCEIIMIGNGPLYESITEQININDLSNIIFQKAPCLNSEVINFMRNCHIICTTSDKNEGWGAVLNEGMAAACCPVASIKAGSTSFLIKNGFNGISYNTDSEMINAVEYLIDNPIARGICMKMAYDTINNNWNAKLAVPRFLKFCEAAVLDSDKPAFTDGPMSKA